MYPSVSQSFLPSRQWVLAVTTTPHQSPHIPMSWQCSHFTFLVSEVIPGYVLASEDLELEASAESKYMVVVLLGQC